MHRPQTPAPGATRRRVVAIVGGLVALVALFFLIRPRDDPDPRATSGPTPPDVTTPAETPLDTGQPPTSPSEEVREVEVEYENGEVRGPARVPVARGQRLRIEVTSDVDEEVHVHGYDFKKDVGPDSPAVFDFVANVSGVFEVELEHSTVLLFRLEVGA